MFRFLALISVDGGWSAWGNWGQCQPPCGIGLRFRRRECNNPIPTANGKQCVGDSKEIAICNTTCTGKHAQGAPSNRPEVAFKGSLVSVKVYRLKCTS